MLEGQENHQMTEGTPRWMGIAVVGLAILSLLGVGLAWNAGGHARDAEQSLSAQAKTYQASEDAMTQRMAQAERTNAELQSEVNLVGDKLKLIPGHCDPTVNLYDTYVCMRNGCVEALWPITARGALL